MPRLVRCFWLVLALALLRPPFVAIAGGGAISATGDLPAGLESYDHMMRTLMARNHIPGGALAVAKDGRLVFSRGYGLADRENNVLVQPDALFRIASISKPITAVATLHLLNSCDCDQTLDSRAFDVVTLEPFGGGPPNDARVSTITIRQLLQHTGGWNRDKRPDGFDPMFRKAAEWTDYDVSPPLDCPEIIQLMLDFKLDFDPGTTAAYSNFGYCILGRVIAKLSGMTYADYVQQNVLSSMGITRMQLAHSTKAETVAGEVKYYDYPNAPLVGTALSTSTDKVPSPYGGFYIEAMDAHGGWLASAIDLVRFTVSLDGSKASFLAAAQKAEMLQPPPHVARTVRDREVVMRDPNRSWIGLGWLVRPAKDAQGEFNWWHSGSLPGTASYLVRHGKDHVVVAAVFNSRPKRGEFFRDLDHEFWHALHKVTTWPTGDLFK